MSVAAAFAAGLAGSAQADDDPIAARMTVIDKTEGILVGKNTTRAAELRARVRALYKLSRAGSAPLWVDAGERGSMLRRRGAARRILVRDLQELEILREELEVVLTARSRLQTARTLAEDAVRPERGSLIRPVRGAVVSSFGRYRGRRSKTRLTNRGIKLASRQGKPVRAPHAGRVDYAGPLRGLDTVVVIARDDGVRSVVGKLGEAAVAVGDDIAAGDEIGTAAGRRIYLEVRIDVDAGGLPIDPAPLLHR